MRYESPSITIGMNRLNSVFKAHWRRACSDLLGRSRGHVASSSAGGSMEQGEAHDALLVDPRKARQQQRYGYRSNDGDKRIALQRVRGTRGGLLISINGYDHP